MNRILLAGLLLAAGPSLAQENSDLMPTPAAPAPGQGAYYPGMPLPAPPAAAPERGPVSKTGTDKPEAPKPVAPTGRLLGEMPRTVEESSAESDDEEASPLPAANGTDTHVVKKGDTLWEISSFYFKNPYLWPKLWAYNPSITNPHWIYPGDVVRLAPALVGAAAVPAVAAAPEEEHLLTPIRAPLSTGVFLRQTGFVEPHELDSAGRIVGSKEEKLMLATLDEAYVEFPNLSVKVGDRFSVYKPLRTIRHPVTGKRIGEMVQIFGEVEVKTVTDGKMARVLVIDCTEDMARGFRVGPLKRQFKMIEPRTDARDITGLVVATLHPTELVGSQVLVFLDRGKNDGVELGNRFQIVRRGDGYQPLRDRGLPVDDKRFPRETVGEVIVIDLRDTTATGIVTRTVKETQVGDRVEARIGY